MKTILKYILLILLIPAGLYLGELVQIYYNLKWTESISFYRFINSEYFSIFAGLVIIYFAFNFVLKMHYSYWKIEDYFNLIVIILMNVTAIYILIITPQTRMIFQENFNNGTPLILAVTLGLLYINLNVIDNIITLGLIILISTSILYGIFVYLHESFNILNLLKTLMWSSISIPFLLMYIFAEKIMKGKRLMKSWGIELKK